MSTATNTNNTDTNAAGSSRHPINHHVLDPIVPPPLPPPTTTPTTTTTSLGGWAGALFSILLELESLSGKVLSDLLQHQLNDFGMSFDSATDARTQTRNEADATKSATMWEGAGAAISAGVALGSTAFTIGYGIKSSAGKTASEANTQFEQLNKMKTNILNGPNEVHVGGNPLADPNIQTGLDAAEQARIAEWKEGRFSDTAKVVNDDPTRDFGYMEGDELREYDLRLSTKIGGDNRDAVLAKMDKAIEQASSDRAFGQGQIQNFTQKMQFVEGIAQNGANAMSSFGKAPLNQKAGYDRATATMDQTEQQASAQASANLKAFADKMAESGSNAVSQFIQAIQIGLKTA